MAVPRRVSVIVPTRGGTPLLAEALGSIRAIEGPDLSFEILVGDNGSNAETRKITDRFGARYFPVSRQGAASARNAGLRAATGDYIAHLDDDDLWTAEHVRSHLRLLEAQPELAAVVGQIVSTDVERVALGKPWPASVPDTNGDFFLTFMNYFPQVGGTVARASVRESVGEFDESLLGDADWDWHLRIAKRHRIGFVAVPSVLFRQRPSGSADQIHLKRVNYTRRIFFRHALTDWRRWESIRELIRSYGNAMTPYYSYFFDAALERSRRGDHRGAAAAIGHALELAPVTAVRDVVGSTALRGSLRAAARGWLSPLQKQ
ncbi:MAG: glycosyltransferase family A protein [Myxococcales bacterium]